MYFLVHAKFPRVAFPNIPLQTGGLPTFIHGLQRDVRRGGYTYVSF